MVLLTVTLATAGSAGTHMPPTPVALCAVPELGMAEGCPDQQMHIPAVRSFDGVGAIVAAASPDNEVAYIVAGNALQPSLMLHRIGTAGHIPDYPIGTGFLGTATMSPVSAAVSHDGRSLAVTAVHPDASGGWIVMFDTEDGSVRWAEPLLGGNVVRALLFTPNDAKLMVAGGTNSAFAAAFNVTDGSILWTRSWKVLGDAEWDIVWNLDATVNRVVVVGTSAEEQRDIVYHLMDPESGKTLAQGRIDTGWDEWAKGVVLAPDGRMAYFGFHQGVMAIPLHPSRAGWETYVPLAGGFSDEWPTALSMTPDGSALVHLGQEVIGPIVQRLDVLTGEVQWLARPIVPETQLWTSLGLTPSGDMLYLSGIGYTAFEGVPPAPNAIAEMHLTLERIDARNGDQWLPHRADTSLLGWESAWAVAATDGGAALAGVALPTFTSDGTGQGVVLAYWAD